MVVPYVAVSFITRAFLPQMLRRKSGHIVKVTSVGAYRAIPGAAAYTAARWAMRGFSEALAAQLQGTNNYTANFTNGFHINRLWNSISPVHFLPRKKWTIVEAPR